MHNLLSKDKVVVLNEYNDSITEAAVHWNDSALGILTNALLKPISWLKGSIKKGIKRQQINNLVTQYGMEYVKAIKAIDMPDDAENSETQPETNVQPDDTTSNTDNNDDLNVAINNEYKTMSTLNKYLQVVSKWKETDFFTSNNNRIKDLFQKTKDSYIKYDKVIDITNFLIGLKLFNPDEYNDDSKSMIALQTNINKFFNDLKTLDYEQFVSIYGKQYTQKINKIIENFNDLDDNFKNVQEHLNANKKSNLKVGEEYVYTNSKGIQKIVKLISTDKSFKPGADKIYLTDDDVEIDDLDDGVVFVLFKDKSGKYSEVSTTMAVKATALKTKQNNSYNFINEASEYMIPNNIQDLFPQEQLEEAKKIEGIKEKSFDKINLIALNTIKYNADYIINSKSNDKADNSAVLKKIWDKGVLDINNYFQDVINVDEVTSKITGNVDAKTKKTIESDQNTLTELQQLGLSEIFPVGKKFDVNKIYAFQGTFVGQNKKTFKHTFLMSPTINFVEDVNGNKTYWFKLLGSYKFDKKKNTNIRINPFLDATNNKKISDNFNNTENAYYVALSALRPATSSKMYVYSNTGKYFFNNNIFDNVEIAEKEIVKYKKANFNDTIRELGPISNIFGFTVNQRFTVDDEVINNNKFPGVQLSDGKEDKNIDIAKTNHEKLMSIIK